MNKSGSGLQSPRRGQQDLDETGHALRAGLHRLSAEARQRWDKLADNLDLFDQGQRAAL